MLEETSLCSLDKEEVMSVLVTMDSFELKFGYISLRSQEANNKPNAASDNAKMDFF